MKYELRKANTFSKTVKLSKRDGSRVSVFRATGKLHAMPNGGKNKINHFFPHDHYRVCYL